jgi:GNAT superfamily N-acetyltransferase
VAEPALELPPLPPLRYDESALAVDDFIALAQRVSPGDYNARKTAAAVGKTVNITAWDGPRLVGVARVLSDGYFHATLADLFVDPDYRKRGVGRELMNRAFERTPRGALFAGARRGSAPFFERLGCERGPAGFTMHRAATSNRARAS